MDINDVDCLGIAHVLKRGTGEILEESDRSIFVVDTLSGAYLLATEDKEEGKMLLDKYSSLGYELLMVTDKEIANYAREKYGFCSNLECYQVAYYGKSPDIKANLTTRYADLDDVPTIAKVYDILNEEELSRVVGRKKLLLGYWQGELVGFIGEHMEGSLGLLYIFPEFRRRGFASELEKIYIAKTIEEGFVPFGQVVKDNVESLKLQEKLGFKRSDNLIYWMWEPLKKEVNMDVKELIKSRHSVREYLDKPIEEDKKKILDDYTAALNEKYGTSVIIVYDDENGFKNAGKSYGNFCNCKNYIVLIGPDAETCGYVGELIVLKAQSLGLNTCFVALTYKRSAVKKSVTLKKGDKIQCSVALGYGKTQGHERKSKTKEEILITDGTEPDNIDDIIEACLLAPTAINQQKFVIEVKDGQVDIKRSGFGFYADVDLGIVKAHKDLIMGSIEL